MSASPLSYTDDELRILIPRLIDEIGIPPHLKGCKYLILAIGIVIRKPDMIRGVTTGLYQTIAQSYNTTPACVERNMRTAIKASVKSGKLMLYDSYFACALRISGTISASCFIAILSEKLRHNLLTHPDSNGRPA